MKRTIIRKDGITYEREIKNPNPYKKCLCLRLNEETFNELKKYGNPSKMIRELIENFLKKESE